MQDHVVLMTEGSHLAGGPYPLDPSLISGALNLAVATLLKGIDDSINRSRRSKAHERLAPLLSATSDIDFRNEFWEALDTSLGSSPWLKISDLVTTSNPDARPVHEEEVEDENLLILSTIYYLVPDATAFVIRTEVRYFLAGTKVPIHTAVHEFESTRVHSQGDRIEVWAADDGRRFRSALREGISETMAMLRDKLRLDSVDAARVD